MVLMLLLKGGKSLCKGVLALHCGEDICTGEVIPRSGYDNCVFVKLTKHLNTILDLMLLGALGVGEDDGRGVRYLVAVKLAEVLQIHLALVDVSNGGKAIENGTVLLSGFSRANNVGELANTRGLDYNSVGLELVQHLLKRL